ncbi:hypothetical protein DMENIID0001_113770 [Sergentomyia squamirostris]
MRRKTDRSKANAPSESPEKPAARRSTRRGGRATPAEEVMVVLDSDKSDSSSESEEEYSPRKKGRGRRGGRAKQSSGSEREVKTPKPRGRKRGSAKKLMEEPLEEKEEEVEEEPPQQQVEPETIVPDDEDEQEQENGGEKVSIEIVPADVPGLHVTEDSQSGFPQRASTSPDAEEEPSFDPQLYDDDVQMKTLSPQQPSESVVQEKAESPKAEQQRDEEVEQQPSPQEATPEKEAEKEESDEEEEKNDETSKRSSSPEEGELPDQSNDGVSKAADSGDEQSKESREIQHSKSEQNSDDEERPPVKKSPVKEVKPKSTFAGKLNRNAGVASIDEQTKRKRRWFTRKPTSESIIDISTDSLKPLISDVKPVPLTEVKLDLTSDNEGIVEDDDEIVSEDEVVVLSKEKKEPPVIVEKVAEESRSADVTHPIGLHRKIMLVNEDVGKTVKPPTPPKNSSTCILYITNLVRPFTVLQLKGLLARTGRIVENGFWIDKIKSKCFVQYETEDQAVETRHALHGVRWPTSNPKCLHVDFGSETDMRKAIESTAEDMSKHGDAGRGDRIVVGWERDRIDGTLREQTTRPIREWDVGKRDDREKEKERDQRGRRERSKEREEVKRTVVEGGMFGRERRRSLSASPARKFKKENEPQIRLLDDLFRKTKATPCIYWLPLTAEQIAVKEEARNKSIQEHQKRMEELRKERSRERARNERNRRDSRRYR